MAMKKLKGDSTCSDCGDKFFPYADKEAMTGITATMEKSHGCGKMELNLLLFSADEDK